MTCPSFEELLSARAAPAAHGAAVAHAGACVACSSLWRTLELLAEAPAAAAWTDVPEPLARAARALPGTRRAQPDAARLLHDSATARPAAALRGAGPAARHLHWESGALKLRLAVLSGEAAGDTLVGLLSGADAPDEATCLLAGEHGARWTPLEPNGDFRFEGVAPGRYLLLAEAGADRLLVPDIDLTVRAGGDPLL